ncbi:GIY-YIG nuclease family protein [Thiomicrospira microaerophila]|uniref:GIY-YIG nuclease family protein n=1 Tax=Thiomicrospira microaerophila TaxID=406020 RepID=UPI0005C8FE89|nr:GIY-YIG nuclease family protein [Thiomicrospira microaerophila]
MIKHNPATRKKKTFEELVANDTLGLFDGVTASKKRSQSSNNSLIDNFEKINNFYETHQREPKDSDDLEESKLARALARIRSKDSLRQQVMKLDSFGLLNNSEVILEQQSKKSEDKPTQSLKTLDDVFGSGLLDDESSDIFQLKYVTQKREKPEEIAKKKPCPDFGKYIPFFVELDKLVENRQVEIKRFTHAQQIKKGDIFISGGLYCFVADVGEYRANNDGRYDPRLRVIYSNGTESNLLLWSLGKSLYEDPNGKQIIRGLESIYEQFNVDNTLEGSVQTGEIYFLRSLSNRPEIRAIPNLMKIGVTTKTTAKRIESAETDKTYLEAPVEILKILPCYNLNAPNLEKLIQNKLHHRRKKIKITSPGGGVYTATEWFDVTLDEAIQAVSELLNRKGNQ